MPNDFLEMFRWAGEQQLRRQLAKDQLAQQATLANQAQAQQMQEFLAQHGLAQQQFSEMKRQADVAEAAQLRRDIGEGIVELPGGTVNGTLPAGPMAPGAASAYSAPVYHGDEQLQDVGAGKQGYIVPRPLRMMREGVAAANAQKQISWINHQSAKDITEQLFGIKPGDPRYDAMAMGLPYRPPQDIQGMIVDSAFNEADGDPKKVWKQLEPKMAKYFQLARGPEGAANALFNITRVQEITNARLAQFYRNRITAGLAVDPSRNPGQYMREYAKEVQKLAMSGELGPPDKAAGVVASLMHLQDAEMGQYRAPSAESQMLMELLSGGGTARPTQPAKKPAAPPAAPAAATTPTSLEKW